MLTVWEVTWEVILLYEILFVEGSYAQCITWINIY